MLVCLPRSSGGILEQHSEQPYSDRASPLTAGAVTFVQSNVLANVVCVSEFTEENGEDEYVCPGIARKDEPPSCLTKSVEVISSCIGDAPRPAVHAQQEQRRRKMTPADDMNERLHALDRAKVIILDCSCRRCIPAGAAASHDAARRDLEPPSTANLPRIGSIAGWRMRPSMNLTYSRSIWPKAVAEGPMSLITTQSHKAFTYFLARHGFEAARPCRRPSMRPSNSLPTEVRWSEHAAARALARADMAATA